MALTFHTVNFRNAMLSSLLISAGTNTNPALGGLTIYPTTVTRPLDPSVSATGQLVGALPATAVGTQCTMGNFLPSSNGASVLYSPLSFVPGASGTASWFRWYNNAATNLPLIDGTVGVAGSGADLILSTINFTNGVTAYVNAGSLNIPASLGTVMLNVALRNAMNNIWTQAAGNIGLGQSATVNVYSGTAPATADEPATGTLLVAFSTGTTSWGTPSNGGSVLTTITTTAAAAGTPSYARLVKGTYVLQGSCGNTGVEDFVVSTATTTQGVSISLTNATFAV